MLTWEGIQEFEDLLRREGTVISAKRRRDEESNLFKVGVVEVGDSVC